MKSEISSDAEIRPPNFINIPEYAPKEKIAKPKRKPKKNRPKRRNQDGFTIKSSTMGESLYDDDAVSCGTTIMADKDKPSVKDSGSLLNLFKRDRDDPESLV